MWLDHKYKAGFVAQNFLKPLCLAIFAEVTLLKNSPTKREFFNKVRRVF